MRVVAPTKPEAGETPRQVYEALLADWWERAAEGFGASERELEAWQERFAAAEDAIATRRMRDFAEAINGVSVAAKAGKIR